MQNKRRPIDAMNDVKSENDKEEEKPFRRTILGHRSCFAATIEGFERRKQTGTGF
ncbi:hypothetical protein AtNW77_Chr3g0172391 [Arabidopsis thaliana]|uniref:Uncharacterized protein n=4 Tax=Arabidopsis TaxID=3701 RepID=A0A654FCU1_ARATH|nr:uncharacterized protein AT3G15604 [Arabidopsis thaliana]KAG7625367.1 hypothetical protein ISN45_At03g016090 [Arabidopsis thaliana x Arabidopsis arenosa]KAG7631377.1 hypothetical protein ISN44_As03g016100 [Arabidopsis suecica]AEE75701.1 hypothetical protein AT3G15604 [Arabidopsis thaliana]CAA0382548.1 unnamed protein product [Arabidopsis thaliana]VYS57492.1 unnamed protein product [Arabidopsis thaliana]|eukprot:NP_001118641.1 hypothetical protein AT3G15604 [Arabidopsis thaliana]